MGVSAELILTSPATLPQDLRAHAPGKPLCSGAKCPQGAQPAPMWHLPGELGHSHRDRRGQVGSPWDSEGASCAHRMSAWGLWCPDLLRGGCTGTQGPRCWPGPRGQLCFDRWPGIGTAPMPGFRSILESEFGE